MIKGQDIDTLMTIHDTTPGRCAVWIMVIMLLFIRILYLVVLQNLERYRLKMLYQLKGKLELLRSGGRVDEGAGENDGQDETVMLLKEVIDPDVEEAMELYNSMRHKKRW